MTRRTIKSIIWNKLLDSLENATFAQISIFVLLCALSFLMTLILTYTEQTVETIMKVVQAYNFLALKSVISFLVVFNFRNILEALKVPEEKEVTATGNTIE
mgnify:CR=1 FL=1